VPTSAHNGEPQASAVHHVLMTADAVGGVWPYTVDLGAALVDRGVRVTVVVMGPPPSPRQRADAERRGIALLERSCRLEWMDDPWDDVARAGEWLLALERTLMPDVAHLNGYAHAALGWNAPAIVVAHSCVRSWWRAVHGCEPPAKWDRYRAEVTRGLRAARLVISPSAAMMRALAEEYGVTVPGRVIANGRECHGGIVSGPKEPIVLAAGRLWDDAKNIQALCASAPELSWPVYVAGDARAPEGREAAGIEHVRHLGRLPPSELAAWYARAAIYALPARYEPFGLSVLEAALAGCALVLGDIPSLRENWDGAAMFVPPDDRCELACALRGLIEDAPRRERLAVAATARATQFTVARMADAYLRAYEEVLATCAV
jgi:glycogen(starch) synthase